MRFYSALPYTVIVRHCSKIGKLWNWKLEISLKFNPRKGNVIKPDPINPSLEESSIYKYCELCYIIEHSLKPKAFYSSAI